MIRVAVVGAGEWGPNLIRNFDDHQQSEVAWVIDGDPLRREQVAARYPRALLDADPRRAFDDPAVDAVVIATPTVTHFSFAKAALEAGKHVLVEKPATTDYAHALELCQLAERNGRVLMVGHVFLYNSSIRYVKEHLESLGRVYYIAMVRTNLGPIRADVNAAWDLAAHDVSIANYWLEAEPLAASAIGGSWINRGIEDSVFATLRYADGVLVNLHASWLNPRKARDITVVGDRRMLTFDDMNLGEPIRIYDKHVDEGRNASQFIDTFDSFRSGIREGDVTIPKIQSGEPLRRECEHFIDCVIHGKRPLTDGAEAARVVRVLEAIARSVANAGREERVAC